MKNDGFMKKNILRTAIFALLILGLSACKETGNADNNVNTIVTDPVTDPDDGYFVSEPRTFAILEIDNEDVFDKGYYEFFFDYEDYGDKYYQINVDADFIRRWEDTEWKIYVSDYKLPEEYIKTMIEQEEPSLVNEGRMNISSGQWIYLYCEHNSSKYDEPNKCGYEISYYEGMETRTEMTPEAEFNSYLKAILLLIPEGGKDYVSFDVTGDGVNDFCTSCTYGSGMVRTMSIVYDPQNHIGYVLDGYDYDYKVIGVEDGKLKVEESGPNGYGDPVVTTIGTLMIEDGQLIFVKEMSEND